MTVNYPPRVTYNEIKTFCLIASGDSPLGAVHKL